jgi:glycosyltransferase involved in cell wall biosynthesis
MKVIHIPFCFAPDPIGGTEVYVSQLAKDLQTFGVEALIAAPGLPARSYEIGGLSVRRFGFNEKVSDVSELYGPGDDRAAAEFAKILDEEAPDLIHLHAFTAAVSLRLVRAAKDRRIPVVFTYHTPTVSCLRGTMMLWGERFCDGKLDIVRCSSCTLDGLGVDRRLAKLAGRLPPKAGEWLGKRALRGGVWTALRTSEMVNLRHSAFRMMASEVDRIVAVCEWVGEVLRTNEIDPAKIFLSRHGINWSSDRSALWPDARTTAPDETRLAFFGRLERVKGAHILIGALRAAPALKVKLDIYGVEQNPAQTAYRKELVALIADDPRIALLPPIDPSEVVGRLREYDFLAVPSTWLETGPLVALEAFAAGVPVIGWDVGGLAELVRDEIDGLLIKLDDGSHNAWTNTLRRVAESADLRARLKAGVRPPRRSIDVAREMHDLYATLLDRERADPRLP